MLRDFLISKVYAADPDFNDPSIWNSTKLINPTGGITGLLITVTNIILTIGLGLVLVFLALGFIRFITSQGDKVATEQAQKWVTYAVIGAVGLLLVYAIKSFIWSFAGGGGNAPL
jgi:hypothetical protein